MKSPLRILITILGVAGAVALTVVFVLLPMRHRTEEDRLRIEACRAQLVKLQRVTRRIDNLQKEITQLEEALVFFEHRLPQEREIDKILREVWMIAEEKALTPRSIRTSASEIAERYNLQPITLSLEGRFESFYEFLLGLERMPRITKVRQIQIAKSPTKDGVIQADLLMDIFFEK